MLMNKRGEREGVIRVGLMRCGVLYHVSGVLFHVMMHVLCIT